MKRLFFMIAAAVLMASCAHVISEPAREHARTDVSFSAMRQDMEKYKGSTFVFGGIIVSTKNTEEGSVIEAVHTYVDRWGTIVDPDMSEGRFLAITKTHLDPLIYKKRREITFAGVLAGGRTKKMGDITYTYPVFEIKEIYLWKEPKYYYPYYYPPHYSPYMYRNSYWWYDPWWSGPFFYP